MVNFNSTGVQRLVYKAEGLVTGKTVTGYIWSPTLVKSNLQTFSELESGLYYLDYDFSVVGTYIGLFMENGITKTGGAIRIMPDTGSGRIEWPYTVRSTLDNQPIADVYVRVTNDAAGLNKIAQGYTNQSGQVTFQLDPGTIYLWCSKTGVNFENPDVEVVS